MGHFLLRILPLLVLAAACATTGPVRDRAAPPAGSGRALYEGSCQRCHALYMPASFGAEEWGFFVRKYGRKARLSRQEQMLVYDYLARNANRGAG